MWQNNLSLSYVYSIFLDFFVGTGRTEGCQSSFSIPQTNAAISTSRPTKATCAAAALLVADSYITGCICGHNLSPVTSF